jgi:hypothetical protein
MVETKFLPDKGTSIPAVSFEKVQACCQMRKETTPRLRVKQQAVIWGRRSTPI